MDRRRFCFTLGILAPALLVVDGKALADSATPEDDTYLGSASIAIVTMGEGVDEMTSAASAFLKNKSAKADLTASAVDLTTAITKTMQASRSAIEIIPTSRYIYAQLNLQRAAFYAMAAAQGIYGALTTDSNQTLIDAMNDAGRFREAKVIYQDALNTAIINAAKTPTATPRPTIRPTRKPIRTAIPSSTALPAIQPTQGPAAQPTARSDDPTKVPPSQSGPAQPPAQPTSPPPAPPTESPPPSKGEPTTAPSP